MLDKEIDEFVDEINCKFKTVHYARKEQAMIVTGLGLPEKRVDDYNYGDSCKLYIHERLVTRPHSTPEDALNELIGKIEEHINECDRYDEIYWRCKPMIDADKDYLNHETFYYGYARMTVM